MKAAIIIILFVLGLILTLVGEGLGGKIPGIIVTCIAAFIISISSGLFTNRIDKLLADADSPASVSASESGSVEASLDGTDAGLAASGDIQENPKDSVSEAQERSKDTIAGTQESKDNTIGPSQKNPEEVSKEPTKASEDTSKETENTADSLPDISSMTAFDGSITESRKINRYYYTAPTSGTYRFEANRTSGAEVYIRVSGENGSPISDGVNALTTNLEAKKKYVVAIERRNGLCDYTVTIGVPMNITDITGQTTIDGEITYRDQTNQYYYTAPTSGSYHIDTDLTSGAEVRVRVSGENGKSIKYDTNALTIDLEAGKKYIISIEYRNGPCNYTASIGAPLEMANITGQTTIHGQITYQDQKDKYI